MPRKTGKGPSGRGTICESPRGSGRWMAQLPPDERGQRPKRTNLPSQEAAVIAMKELEALRIAERKRIGNPAEKDPTCEELFTLWLDDVVSNGAPLTSPGYRSLLWKHAVPSIGAEKVDGILPAQLQRLITTTAKTVSPATAKNLYDRLHAAFALALSWGYRRTTPNNPMDLVKKPHVERRERVPLTVEEQARFYAVIADDRHEMIYRLAIGLGIRQSELLGLRWRDIDWAKRTLRIAGQLQRMKGKGLVWRATTKGKRTRVVALSDDLIAGLARLLNRQQEERPFYALQGRDQGLVFLSTKGTPVEHSELRRQFKRHLRRAGLPDNVVFHDTRHTFVTDALNSGASTKAVADIVGHRSTRMTEQYSHSDDDTRRAIVDRLAERRKKTGS